MKLLLCIFCFWLSSTIGFSQKKDSLLQVDFLPKMEQELKTNPDLAFEYLCAQKFHSLINAYRSTKRIPELEWSDVLWLAARNHTIWMITNSKLSHNQSKKSVYFSGFSPLDRLKYVHTKFQISCAWGENVLYNKLEISSKDEATAQEIAETCFEQWKHSREHNKNMLTRIYKSHGFSVSINSEGLFYACDLFLELGNKKN